MHAGHRLTHHTHDDVAGVRLADTLAHEQLDARVVDVAAQQADRRRLALTELKGERRIRHGPDKLTVRALLERCRHELLDALRVELQSLVLLVHLRLALREAVSNALY